MFDPEIFYDDVSLHYHVESNIMMDDCGFTVVDVFDIISPNMLYLFKTKKENMVVRGVHGNRVELFWPIKINDEYYYNI